MKKRNRNSEGFFLSREEADPSSSRREVEATWIAANALR